MHTRRTFRRRLFTLAVAAAITFIPGLSAVAATTTTALPTEVLDPDAESPPVPLDWTSEDGSTVDDGEWAGGLGPDDLHFPPMTATVGAGFATFDNVVANSDTYTINLVGDTRISQLRGVVNAAVAEIMSKTGGLVRLSVGSSIQTMHTPAKNEITIYLDDTAQKCGSSDWGRWIGCGGPYLWSRSDGTYVAGAGRVFFPSRFLSSSGQVGTMTHELLHALGLSHYDGVYQGSTQLLHSSRTVSTMQQGDINGIQYLASNRGVIGNLERVAGAAKAVIVEGWALDRNTTASINVHIYVDGKAVRAVTANQSRPDLAGYRLGTAHGFSASVPVTAGSHQVCIYAIAQIVGANPQIGCKTATAIASQPPIGSVDMAVSSSPGALTVGGWSLDPDTRASIQVHLYVDGKYTRGTTANGNRPDVDRVHGLGPAHGFTFTETGLTKGSHRVCVYGIDPQGGVNPSIGCTNVTVTTNRPPIGALDMAVSPGVGGLTVGGWSLDPDTRASIQVHLYVDGKYTRGTTANGNRPDVDRVHGLGPAHGFTFTETGLTKGSHRVCVYGIDAQGGSNPSIGCKNVTITANAPPIGALDMVTQTVIEPDPDGPDAGAAPIAQTQVAGWALDPDTTEPIGVHFYVDGRYHSGARAAQVRADVARAHGSGAEHGFNVTLTDVPLGRHEICVWGLDSDGGPNPKLGCRTTAG